MKDGEGGLLVVEAAFGAIGGDGVLTEPNSIPCSSVGR
jgi:hypothetical protein